VPQPQVQSDSSKQKKRLVIHLVEAGILIILLVASFGPAVSHQIGILTRSSQARIKARDEQRLHDQSLLQAAILQYRLQQGYYPASSLGVPYIDSSESGQKMWIGSMNSSDLPFDPGIGAKIASLPKDPVNKNGYVYRYRSSSPPADTYELDIRLESDPDGLMKKDGGDNDQLYEAGNDLELLN